MQFETKDGQVEISPDHAVVAGWTGRDAAGVQRHIDELAELGVAPPSQVPLFYQVSGALLTQEPSLTVLSPDTSGEAEPLIVVDEGEVWLGLGSDHTDRGLEATSVAHSKQVCGKPVASHLWRLNDVADRLDSLVLRSWVDEGNGWTLYQDGTLAAIRPLVDLLAGSGITGSGIMLCGTLPAIGGVRPAGVFKAQLCDPVTDRTIELSYAINVLPVVM